MKNIAIVQFPGSNTERETSMACKRVGLNPVDFMWNEKESNLTSFDGYIIIGGFSYEDRSRAGIIAGLDPLLQIIKISASSKAFKCSDDLLSLLWVNLPRVLTSTNLKYFFASFFRTFKVTTLGWDFLFSSYGEYVNECHMYFQVA